MNPVRVVGIDHIQLAMPPGGETKARWFYGTVLGFREVQKPPEVRARGGCWFVSAGVVIHLGVQDDFVAAKKAHPAFRVDRLDDLQKHLEVSGIQITHDPALPEIHRFHAFDPFDNRLEFIQDGDGFSQRPE